MGERQPLPKELPEQKVKGGIPWLFSPSVLLFSNSASSRLNPVRSQFPGEALKLSLLHLPAPSLLSGPDPRQTEEMREGQTGQDGPRSLSSFCQVNPSDDH